MWFVARGKGGGFVVICLGLGVVGEGSPCGSSGVYSVFCWTVG